MRLIVLYNRSNGNRFYTSMRPSETKEDLEKEGFEVLGIVESSYEAQTILYGKDVADMEEFRRQQRAKNNIFDL